MVRFTRRAALAALGASAAAGIWYALRGVTGSPVLRIRLTDGGMMGASPADMSLYMDMFNRHTEITRTVEEIPGGVRTTTQSNAPDLAAKLHAHVSSIRTVTPGPLQVDSATLAIHFRVSSRDQSPAHQPLSIAADRIKRSGPCLG